LGAAIPLTIPLFPLPDVVLFPGMPLSLHIFEPRYRRMVEDVQTGDRVVGMTLLRPGYEADYYGTPDVYPIGCAGGLEHCEPLVDGRFNIVLKGLTRFRIEREHPGRPYRRADVSPLADDLGEPLALESARKKVMAAIGQAADGPAVLVMQPELPHDVFVNALCQSLTLSPVERQSLVETGSVLARYERLCAILDFRALEQKVHGSRPTPLA
jgi:Lon protease-like protein